MDSFDFQEGTRVSHLEIPLLAFAVRVPPDGLPILADWASHALSIWCSGYESWREAMEFRPVSINLGDPLSYHSIEVTKGAGRISILWFTVLYTYLHLQKKMNEEAWDQFRQWLKSTLGMTGSSLETSSFNI